MDNQIEYLNARLAERYITMELTERAKDYFAENGFDPTYGARPLKRLLQKEIETVLGRKILAEEVAERSRVVVDYGTGGLTFDGYPVAEAA